MATQSVAWAESKAYPGLYVRREGEILTFRFGQAWEAYSARTGDLVETSDTGSLPASIREYVQNRILELLPPHRRGDAPQKEVAPPTANREATTLNAQKTALSAPIVSATSAPVKEETTPAMPIDFTNTAAVKAASALALRIKASLGIPELEARRNLLLANNRTVEIAYRTAQLDVSQAKRLVGDAEDALKRREQELVFEASEAKGDDGKKKYTVDGAKGAAATARKTDPECVALTQAIAEANQAHYDAERRLAEAEAEQKALVREFDLLRADLDLASARVNAFMGLDGEPAAQQPAA